MIDSRARLLRVALGFLTLEPREPELRQLHRCFDNWLGILTDRGNRKKFRQGGLLNELQVLEFA